MSYRVRLSSVAKAGLGKETRYSAKHWGAAHDKRYMAELRARIRALKTDALQYSLYDEAVPGVRIMTWKGNRVVYILDKDAGLITVLAVTSIYQSIDTALSRLP